MFVVDNAKVSTEIKNYRKIPILTNFINTEGVDLMEEEIQKNYSQIKADIGQIVKEELKRISSDENLKHLIKR